MVQIVIEIPKEFEEHFNKDKFEDSLHRLSADAHLLAGKYEQETAFMLMNAFKNAKVLPDHGPLIDLDELCDEYEDADYDFYEAIRHTFTMVEEYIS